MSTPRTARHHRLIVHSALVMILALLWSAAPAAAGSKQTYRWEGAHFAFCFVSDDGTLCNLGWALEGLARDFRFTVAVNCGVTSALRLDGDDMHWLHQQGFEIANHAWSHGIDGLPEICPMPPRGSLAGYFLCDADPDTAATYFRGEISRDRVAAWADIPATDVRAVAYPRHRYLKAVIDSLVSEGYIGARGGGKYGYATDSYGDFQTPAVNGWDQGISLYRVPLRTTTATLFGNHSAVPPVHFSYEEFRAIAVPMMEQARVEGGIFALYAHHFGDDDDSMGNINYGSGGLTSEELGWMVDLVREYGGRVMTFGEAVAYYRSRTTMVDVDGDKVWMPPVSSAPARPLPTLILHPCVPNPFNPRTTVSFELREAVQLSICLYDAIGRRVTRLAEGSFAAGHHALVWDGRDEGGRPAGAGTYILQLSGPGVRQTRKLMLLK